MADLIITPISRTGVDDSTFVAASAGGDAIPNTGTTRGKVFLEVINSNGSLSRTVTVTTPKTLDTELNLAVADHAVVVPGPGRAKIGPFPPSIYNDNDNKVQLTYSDSGADLTVAAFSLEQAPA